MQNQAQRSRDMAMQMAREARKVERNYVAGEPYSFGSVRFYETVEYYVRQARRMNHRLVKPYG